MDAKYDGIIFDLDGTLWDATKPIKQSWNEVLQRHSEIKRKPITEEELGECMGLTMYKIAAKLFPNESEHIQKMLMDELCHYENEYLAQHGGILYDGLEDVLKKLHQNFRLYIVSNCQDGYIQAFIKAHHMEAYFDDTECWGRTRTSKGISNKILMERNGLKCPVYVGDTQKDAQSAKEAGIDFIYAAYGFGKVNDKDYIKKINKLKELL